MALLEEKPDPLFSGIFFRECLFFQGCPYFFRNQQQQWEQKSYGSLVQFGTLCNRSNHLRHQNAHSRLLTDALLALMILPQRKGTCEKYANLYFEEHDGNDRFTDSSMAFFDIILLISAKLMDNFRIAFHASVEKDLIMAFYFAAYLICVLHREIVFPE